MASILKERLEAGICLVAGLLLVGWPTGAKAEFDPGLQHVYPFYYPDDDLVGNGNLPSYSSTPSALPTTSTSLLGIIGSNAEAEQVTVTTHGGLTIRVHRDIANNVSQLYTDLNGYLVNAGENPVGGWGYRSHARQIALRKKNCGGDTHFHIYQKPSGECSPPTARPGSSLHERGLAIDFYHSDDTSRPFKSGNAAAFNWLGQYAASYGLRNLPSEPWHWSTTGG